MTVIQTVILFYAQTLITSSNRGKGPRADDYIAINLYIPLIRGFLRDAVP